MNPGGKTMLTRLFLLLIFILLLPGCSSDSPSGPGAGVSAASMLGLSDGRILEYSQIDTTIVYVSDPDISPDPVREVRVTSRSRTITMGQDESNWIIRDGLVPMLNLIVSGDYVLHNGFYSNYGVADTLVYFQTPAILMTNGPAPDDPWTYSTGEYQSAGDSLTVSFYFAYFGYQATKTFVGREEVLVTAGAFDAYRFEVDLFLNPLDTIPVAHATEYYAANEGLVKLRFEDSGFIRTLRLVQSH